ncbi:MAG: small subunit ribosomal protein S9 [Candidatus Berkelbacteria bacterium Gr01-1014_85]|uniref:Small ribosomal subunit protein uS9 n=1 Tax=Candidatus Berkelbacteria bacterium Gr01-1014_85 TaxID=2017150 RepID=A0A554JAW6_9BACT|nr:MAG: small subunit ribosomal protein S9 [Candidatus Berkelbacteria bacterium Gr01-1014_85]
MDQQKYFFGLGRRKTATARVRLVPGNGALIINEKPVEPNKFIDVPLVLVGQAGKFDIHAHVNGGGMVSQIEAIRLGVSRALIELDANVRSSLRKNGLLTRDPRIKERKKPGLKGARRAPQWAKR